MKLITKEVKIALVAIIGVIVLFAGLQFLKGLKVYSDDLTYFVDFDDVGGLSPSCAVYAGGYKVGTVKDIEFGYGSGRPTLVEISIDKRMQVPEGSFASIESDMLGNIKLNIMLGDLANERISEGDTIKGSRSLGALDMAGGLIPDVERMLPKLDSILASLNLLLSDPGLSNIIHNTDAMTSDLASTASQLDQLMASMNRDLPTMMDKADGVLSNTEQLTKTLSEADIKTTIDNINSTLANIELMSARLNSNDGTLGLLLNDPQLYNNLSSTMSSADSLLIDLKAHPKRYVHFSLFGKKDK